jgi:hypothetical protein
MFVMLCGLAHKGSQCLAIFATRFIPIAPWRGRVWAGWKRPGLTLLKWRNNGAPYRFPRHFQPFSLNLIFWRRSRLTRKPKRYWTRRRHSSAEPEPQRIPIFTSAQLSSKNSQANFLQIINSVTHLQKIPRFTALLLHWLVSC